MKLYSTMGGCMNKRVLVFLCIAIILSLVIFIMTEYISNNHEVTMNEVNLEDLDELIIGSEPPKLLYADKDKVIFDCNGVFVYDMKAKMISQSFDVLSIDSDKNEKRKWNSFVSQDGKLIIFMIGKSANNDLVDRYCYSIENDKVTEIDEKEYLKYQNSAFEWKEIDYNDDLYEKTSGRIVPISDNEYVYLTFHDWLVSTIQVVYVKDNKETYYSIFDNY